jgi:hypothetical protein
MVSLLLCPQLQLQQCLECTGLTIACVTVVSMSAVAGEDAWLRHWHPGKGL